MKLGVVYTEEVHNAGFRAMWPAEALRKQGRHSVDLVVYDPRTRFNYEELRDFDVVHVFRRSDLTKAADDLRRHGVAITYDNDDDIRLTPKEYERYKELGGLFGVKDFRSQLNMMRRAHVVSTTTEVLAAKWGEEYDGPIEVIPNHVVDFHFPSTPRNKDGVVIGWFAGREHVADARRLEIAAVLRRVMERRPEVRVVTMGVKLDNLDPARYEFHNYIPLHELMTHVRKFDIGIAPISDIPMSYARSDIKVKEYAACGVPWVASNRGSYARIEAKSAGGILVDDDGWEETLVDLVASKFKRARQRRAAEKWGKSQHIDKHVGRWEAVWERAIEIAAETPADDRRAAAAR
jgi:glycosyltransferase involved in cell wall biosynthesis